MDEDKSGIENKDVSTRSEITEDKKPSKLKFKVKSGSFDVKSFKDKLLANKKLLAIGVSIVLLLIVGGSYLLMQSSSNDDQQITKNEKKESALITASISYTEGRVEKRDGEAYVVLKVDDVLNEGDYIHTSGATSRATIALGNGSFVRMNGDTEITLTELREDEIVVMQENGQVYSRVSPGTDTLHTIETNTTTYVAMGTAFKTTAGGDEESVEVYDSSVDVKSESSILVKQGEKYYVKNVQATDKENKVEPLDIEVVKADAFVSWCRTEDEKIESFKQRLGFLSDITAPALSVTSPADKSTITVDSDATKGSVAFKGKTDKDAKVTVQSLSVSGAAPVEVDVKSDGSFESGEIDGIIGASKYEVIAQDTTGNKTKQTITVTFKKKSTAATYPITLSYGGYIDSKYQISWTTTSSFIEADGFKVVWNTSGDPTYPKTGTNAGAELVSNEDRSTGMYLDASTEAERKYYVRVCRYTDGECDNYSNTVTITVPKKT